SKGEFACSATTSTPASEIALLASCVTDDVDFSRRSVSCASHTDAVAADIGNGALRCGAKTYSETVLSVVWASAMAEATACVCAQTSSEGMPASMLRNG